MMTRIALVLMAIVGQIPVASVRGDDWPQILGPHRNGIAKDQQLAEKWAGGKPKKVWESPIGSGFAGVAVANNQVVLFHREKANDQLSSFAADSGKPLWTTSFPANFQPQIVDDDGPRAVPTIDQGNVYAYSATGKLYCVDLKTGEKRWERATHEDFGANGGYFGAGSSPLVDEKRVIVIVGGDKKGAGVVAFDSDSGKTVWSAVNDQASYSAPVITTINDTRHLLCITRLNFVSLDPSSGKERFRTPFGQRGPTVNGAIPVISGGNVLLTASYGIGAQWLAISPENVEVVWNEEILAGQYATPILHEGAIYAVDGRQDGGPIALKCFDPVTRNLFWSESLPEYATLISADKKLLVMQTNGTLKLVSLTRSRFQQLGSASLVSGKTRALPALAQGRIYIRNEKTLACFDLSK
jgi:outer membrane protein assembly factor BamB